MAGVAGGDVVHDRLHPGRLFRDAPFAPEMVVIPEGEFWMGSREQEQQHRGDEGPRHHVVISEPFAMGRFTVTFEEWVAFMGRSGYAHLPDDEGWGKGRRPVINVHWDDAVAYTRWLGRETGHLYRLPTEAEWEYACRAGSITPYSFGKTLSTEQANFNGTKIDGVTPHGAYRACTVPVGSFPPNDFGLHEMHGNVWEWVEDCWHPDYNGAPWEGHAWIGVGLCKQRVARGGSWNFFAWDATSSFRVGYDVATRYPDVGFRVVRELEKAEYIGE